MENDIECAFCKKVIEERPLYNAGGGDYYHLKCNDLINTIVDSDKEGLVRILNLINNIQKKQS